MNHKYKWWFDKYPDYEGPWAVTESDMIGFAEYCEQQGYTCDYKLVRLCSSTHDYYIRIYKQELVPIRQFELNFREI